VRGCLNCDICDRYDGQEREIVGTVRDVMIIKGKMKNDKGTVQVL
jgi:hypothetical protein